MIDINVYTETHPDGSLRKATITIQGQPKLVHAMLQFVRSMYQVLKDVPDEVAEE